MASPRKPAPPKSIRQSVTIPASLAAAVRRTAKDRNLTISRALVFLAEIGVRAEADAREQLKSLSRRLLAETDPARKNKAAKDLLRSLAATGAIPEDSLR